MMELPTWLDEIQSENSAAAMVRALPGRSAAWGELVATAQAVLAFAEEESEAIADGLVYDEANVIPLIAAARILDAAHQTYSGVSEEDRYHLGLLAGVAFSTYANFPSAEAVLRRSIRTWGFGSPAIAVAVATAAPNLIPEALPFTEPGTLYRGYLESLNLFHYSGDDRADGGLPDALVGCLLTTVDPFDQLLLGSCRLALNHILRLSVVRTLSTLGATLPHGYPRKLVDNGIRVLLPPQYRALLHDGLATSSANAIIALPTGTGKTFLGEIALLSALGDLPGVACYLTPYVALGRQVSQSIERHAPASIRVHRMIGGYREAERLDPLTHREVVVATPERMDALLRTSPDLVPHIRCVVVDEAHGIQYGARGARLEGIITRLRLLQQRGKGPRIVLLSAVLSEYENLARWLGTSPESVTTDTWRPTARRLAFWREGGKLSWHFGGDPVRPATSSSDTLLGEIEVPWPENHFYPAEHFGAVRRQEPLANRNVAYLTDYLWKRYEAPILLACSTKAGSRNVAAAVADRFDVIEPLSAELASIVERIDARHPYLRPLIEYVRRGVAFHNASLPHDIRQLIEEAAKARVLRAVAATTTLAEGVDLPFRFTVIVDWLTWQDAGQAPMPPLLFRNIAGRCGRPGEFTEGDTIVFDNPVAPGLFAIPSRRKAIQDATFLRGTAGELRSALQAKLLGRPAEELAAALAAQLLGAIPENPEADDIASLFAENTLAAHAKGPADTSLRDEVSGIVASLLDDSDLALATAASPVKLTPLGAAANATGFSPESARAIARFLKGTRLDNDLPKAASVLLHQLGRLPEQGNRDLVSVLSSTSSRFCVKPTDLEAVVGQWVTGDEIEEIFGRLPYVLRSSKRPKANEWLVGQRGASDWDSDFDGFMEFVASVLQQFVPWAMRAASVISDLTGGWSTVFPWRAWADMVENGVDTAWALAALDAGAPGGRKVIATVGRAFPPAWVSTGDPLGLSHLQASDNRPELEHVVVQARGALPELDLPGLRQLFSWLATRAAPAPANSR